MVGSIWNSRCSQLQIRKPPCDIHPQVSSGRISNLIKMQNTLSDELLTPLSVLPFNPKSDCPKLLLARHGHEDSLARMWNDLSALRTPVKPISFARAIPESINAAQARGGPTTSPETPDKQRPLTPKTRTTGDACRALMGTKPFDGNSLSNWRKLPEKAQVLCQACEAAATAFSLSGRSYIFVNMTNTDIFEAI